MVASWESTPCTTTPTLRRCTLTSARRCKSTMEVNACVCGRGVSKKSPVSCCLPHCMHVSRFRDECCILFDVFLIVTKSLPGPCQCSTGHRCSKTESHTGSGPMVSHPSIRGQLTFASESVSLVNSLWIPCPHGHRSLKPYSVLTSLYVPPPRLCPPPQFGRFLMSALCYLRPCGREQKGRVGAST